MLNFYTRNVFTLIQYKIKHHEPLNTFESLLIIWFIEFIFVKLERYGIKNG